MSHPHFLFPSPSQRVISILLAITGLTAFTLQAQPTDRPPAPKDKGGQPTTPPPGRSSETPARERASEKSRVANARNPIEQSDQKFITELALLTSEELRLSQTAAHRATDSEVKSLAQAVIARHDTLSVDLARLAENNRVTLPTGRSANATLEDAEQTKASAGFDQQYLTDLVTTQKTAISLLEDYAKRADDREIAAYAREQLGKLQDSLRKAEALRERIE